MAKDDVRIIQEFPSQRELKERQAKRLGLDTFSSLVKQGYTEGEARGLIAKYSTLRFEGEVMGIMYGVPTKMSRQAYEILKREGVIKK